MQPLYKSLFSTIKVVKDEEIRVDRLLTQLNFDLTRSQIQKLISHGNVFYKNQNNLWQVVKKPSELFATTYLQEELWRIDREETLKFVSRGGHKLQGALEHFDISCHGQGCWDVGLSTGGFSHCLLLAGAQKVLGTDVGQGQLHPSLKKESRLMAFDKLNGRHPLPEAVVHSFFADNEPKFDLIVVDVSFISLEKIVENLVHYLHKEGPVSYTHLTLPTIYSV